MKVYLAGHPGGGNKVEKGILVKLKCCIRLIRIIIKSTVYLCVIEKGS